MYRPPPGVLARPVEVLDQPFIRSNDSLGRPPLYSPSLACRVVHINPAIIPNLPMCPLPLERVQVHIGFLPLLSSDKCRGFYSIGLRLETAICGRPAFSPASCSPRRSGHVLLLLAISFGGASSATIRSITVDAGILSASSAPFVPLASQRGKRQRKPRVQEQLVGALPRPLCHRRNPSPSMRSWTG